MVHPATLLVIWSGSAFLLQWASSAIAMAAAAICLAASLRFAPRRSCSLMRRSRWLLLSLAILFLFFTPGEYLPGLAGNIGLTREGLEGAGTYLGRLIAMLTSLALLHERIGTPGLLAGLYELLGGLRTREKTVVRLMLVLDEVERKEKVDWRNWLVPAAAGAGTDVVRLQLPPIKALDRWLIGSVLLVMLATGLGS